MTWAGNEIPIILVACIVFFGIGQLVLLNKITVRLSDLAESRSKTAVIAANTAAPAPVVTAAANTSDRGMLIAAISASIAEDLGTGIEQIRIRSFKQL